MKLIRSFILLGILIIANQVSAQTADEIINKHIKAIGGKDVISKIKTQIVEANLSVMGSDLSSESTLQVGVGFKNVANFNGQDIIQVVTPKGGWMINPLQGMTDPQALPEDQVKASQSALFVGGELFEYKSKGYTAELMGKEKQEGVDVYKIKLTKKDGSVSYYYIDTKDNYVIKHESSVKEADGTDLSMTSLFSDFKKTDIGYVVPYTTVRNQGFEMTITVSKIRFNETVDPKIFEMPK